MPRAASGMTIELRQMTAMPTARSRPKSRIIGTSAKRRARKAKTASNVTTRRAGPRLRAVSCIGWSERSRITSSSTRACLIDREKGTAVGIVFFEDEDGLRRGDEALNAMSPPEGAGQRSNVEMYEVALEMKND